jgi:hypothetical protein
MKTMIETCLCLYGQRFPLSDSGGTLPKIDLIIAMTRRQERKILASFPSAEGKTRLLRSFDPLSDHPDVKDPWEPVSEKMRNAYDAIYPAVLGLIGSDRLAGASEFRSVRREG